MWDFRRAASSRRLISPGAIFGGIVEWLVMARAIAFRRSSRSSIGGCRDQRRPMLPRRLAMLARSPERSVRTGVFPDWAGVIHELRKSRFHLFLDIGKRPPGGSFRRRDSFGFEAQAGQRRPRRSCEMSACSSDRSPFVALQVGSHGVESPGQAVQFIAAIFWQGRRGLPRPTVSADRAMAFERLADA